MEKVAYLLAHKQPAFNFITPNCLVSDALYQMTCEKIDHLIVQQADRFKGIITHYDIASKILYENRPLNRIEVAEFMNTKLPVVTSDSSVQNCMQLMERYDARHVVVFDRFDFRGVISAYDLMQEALHNPDLVFSDHDAPRQGYPWNY